jgi:hypothetical protein
MLLSAQQPWVELSFLGSFKPRKKWAYYVVILGINILLYFLSVQYNYKQRLHIRILLHYTQHIKYSTTTLHNKIIMEFSYIPSFYFHGYMPNSNKDTKQ